MQTNKRPVFLDLFKIHLPLTGFVSITHRVTGALLFLSLPLLVYVLQRSLESAAGYAEVQQWLQSWPWRVYLVLVGWWFAHHLFAGLRHMFIDMDIGVELAPARLSAGLALLGGVIVFLISVVVAL